jgi:hypothetical protein
MIASAASKEPESLPNDWHSSFRFALSRGNVWAHQKPPVLFARVLGASLRVRESIELA